MPYAEGLLLLLARLWRATLLFVLGWVLLLVWLAARRAGRRGLEIAVPMWALAAILFMIAVFAPRPALNESLAAGLVVLSAALVIGALAVLFFSGRGPSPTAGQDDHRRAVKHRGPPWENGGW